MTGAQFVNIGSDSATPLQSIIPTGDDTSDNVTLQTLDAYGNSVDMYTWINWAGDNGDEEGWVDDSYAIVDGVTFPAGQGLWVSGSTADQALQTAGAVGKNDVNVTLRAGYTAIVNPFPVSVDLQDILPTGDDTSDNVTLQTLDAYGNSVDMYTWINWAGDNGDEEGWVDDSYTIVEGVSFTPGQGFWVSGSAPTQGLRFAAPEL